MADDQVQHLQSLLDVALLLNSTLSLTDLTEIILERVRAAVPVERVTAFRVDHQKKVVHSLVAQDIREEISMPIGTGIAGTVAATATELDVPDAYADPRFSPVFDRILNFKTRDLIAVPIFNRQGGVTGVLELLNRRRLIGERDLAFLRGMSVYIGLAVENAWLYQEALHKQRVEEELTWVRNRLAEIERITTMNQVILGIMHEINNPLAIAMGNVALIRDELALNRESLNHLRAIESGIDRVANTVRRFARLVEQGAGQHGPLSLTKVLGQVVELRSREWERLGIDSLVDLQPAPVINAQQGPLQVAFLHLLINAEEATVRSRSNQRIGVRLFHNVRGQRVRIEIEDSGPGIPPSARERVFNPFFTTKAPGTATGLGLTTVQSIIERYRGRVWFETTRRRGTTFIVEFPDSSQ